MRPIKYTNGNLIVYSHSIGFGVVVGGDSVVVDGVLPGELQGVESGAGVIVPAELGGSPETAEPMVNEGGNVTSFSVWLVETVLNVVDSGCRALFSVG